MMTRQDQKEICHFTKGREASSVTAEIGVSCGWLGQGRREEIKPVPTQPQSMAINEPRRDVAVSADNEMRGLYWRRCDRSEDVTQRPWRLGERRM